jgi:putative flippase GtrA
MRWLKFNAVGGAGIVIHLGLLALFVHVLEIHYLVATALSIEAAILHKFYWHRRWTWADRFSTGAAPVLGMLLRFNLACGLVSMGGSLFSVRILTGSLGLDPVLSNLLSIAPCALANFLLCDWLVFVRRLGPSGAAIEVNKHDKEILDPNAEERDRSQSAVLCSSCDHPRL